MENDFERAANNQEMGQFVENWAYGHHMMATRAIYIELPYTPVGLEQAYFLLLNKNLTDGSAVVNTPSTLAMGLSIGLSFSLKW